MEPNDSQLLCPICHQPYENHAEKCAFCGLQLNSQVWHPGELTDDDIKKHKRELRQKRDLFINAAISACLLSEEASSKNVLEELANVRFEEYKEKIQSFREDLNNKTSRTSKEIQARVNDLALGKTEETRLFIFDIGVEGISLIFVSLEQEKFNIEYDLVHWEQAVDGLPISRRKKILAVSGGYFALNQDRLEDKINAFIRKFDQTKLETEILFTSAFILGAVNQIMLDFIKSYLTQFSPPESILIRPNGKFLDYLESITKTAPIPYAFRLLVANCLDDGSIEHRYETLFPAEEMLTANSKQLTLRFMNASHGKGYLVIIKDHGSSGISQCAILEAENLPYDEEMTINFLLEERNQVIVSSQYIFSPSSLSLEEIIANIPNYLPSQYPMVDIIFLLDLITSDEIYRKRCELLRKILEEIQSGFVFANVKYKVIGYGDYPTYKYSKDFPADEIVTAQITDWFELPVIDFSWEKFELDDAVRDFESALDEALFVINRVDWRDNTKKLMIALGQRPPYPHKPLPGTPQSGSRFNWKSIIDQLHQDQVACLPIIGEVFWQNRLPEHAREYADEFWRYFCDDDLDILEEDEPDLIKRISDSLLEPLKSEDQQLSVPLFSNN
jgi:hypothetical protein